ncbi:MAG: sugar phosphate isomerase/epimerase [Phycisphaeraceae bacterium]
MSLPIALQLYTIRDAMKADFEGALKQVADMGYQYVELAGLAGRTPEQAKAVLDELGLKAIASHEGIDRLKDDLDGAIKQATTFGYDLLVCPYIGEEYRTAEGYTRAANILADAAAKAKPAGMTVCYHNHAFEFEPIDGGNGMTILAEQAKGVQFELDLFWVVRGGEDPFAWMRKLAGRLPVLHVKDMSDGEKPDFAEVGTGVLALEAMVAEGPTHGVRYLVVEQDGNWIDGDPLASARIGYENLSAWVG